VIAFLQLGLGVSSDLTQSLFTASGVGKLDTKVLAYSVDPSVVRAVGTAHCSIAAAKTDPAVSPSTIASALANLRSGNYGAATVTSRACNANHACLPSAAARRARSSASRAGSTSTPRLYARATRALPA
jgi:hypothetical protein